MSDEADAPQDGVEPPADRDTPATEAPAGWYDDPYEAGELRWWDGEAWSQRASLPQKASKGPCRRCGRENTRKFTGGFQCVPCETELDAWLATWIVAAKRVLDTAGPLSNDWSSVGGELKLAGVPLRVGREAIRTAAIEYLGRRVAYARGPGAEDLTQFDVFRKEHAALKVTNKSTDAMLLTMRRLEQLARARAGLLESMPPGRVLLEPSELLYLEASAGRLQRTANGSARHSGRLLITSHRIAFLADRAGGVELKWSKVFAVTVDRGNLAVSTSARSGWYYFEVADPEMVAALATGALKVAKRHLNPNGDRDPRRIAEGVKAGVWRRDRGRCVECGATEALEFDHIIPHSKGGATSIENLQLLCHSCNMKKAARI